MIACVVLTALLHCGQPDPWTATVTAPGVLDAATLVDGASQDRWLAEDKLRHFAMSFAVTELTYGGARFALEPRHAFALAGAVAALAGLGKEVRDLRAGGPFSVKDLVWDAGGVTLGLLLAHRIE